MIRAGDKVLVCLSGGQDSIALLHTMHQYQFYARSKGMHFSIAASMLSEFNMIRAGDKVLVCLSGGQDSIALLHTMHQYQFYARSKGMHFSIGEYL
ncbi:tRNA 2-thiocytidine biosynthesis protein ttcA [Operophtera brumata]|uniref:tRNA 2-thiocytidine biosynthesis protein ttcA n=1 Tax=Operophtera brumata TaxID=104452 RepID=A0A0L7L098_OPEBR|nr:tRNA 2-thiocytidine biosynthesis protein ttcA [Operophtera brumata]